MKKILILDGHPDKNSFCRALADAYAEGALKGGFQVSRLTLRDLNFNIDLRTGYHVIQELEPDLVHAQEQIKACDHLVLVYPIWWGMTPALLKGFFDRCWLPGFAFKYHTKDPLWDRLLSGRSARMIVTSDAPPIFNLLAYLNAPYKVVKKMILEFCGFRPTRVTAIGRMKDLKENERMKALDKIRRLGIKGR